MSDEFGTAQYLPGGERHALRPGEAQTVCGIPVSGMSYVQPDLAFNDDATGPACPACAQRTGQGGA